MLQLLFDNQILFSKFYIIISHCRIRQELFTEWTKPLKWFSFTVEFTDTTADADADAEADAPPDADDEDDADAPVPNDTSADALAVDVFDDFADALADVAAEAFADTVSNSKHDFSNKQRSTVLLKCMCVHLSNSVLHCNAQLIRVSRKYVVTFLQYITYSCPGIWRIFKAFPEEKKTIIISFFKIWYI